MEENRFRNKVSWFIFLFNILVIWIHALNITIYSDISRAGQIFYKIERFLGETLGQTAVPSFFMISAYLFYRKFNIKKLPEKWAARIKTILIPYILWNTIYYFLYVIGSRTPVISTIIGKPRVSFSILHMADGILHYTYNYVFWYLYQLILLIILAPVLYGILKNTWMRVIYYAFILTGLLCQITIPQLNLDALLYYSIAADFAIHSRAVVESRWTCKRMVCGILVIVAAWSIYYFGNTCEKYIPGSSSLIGVMHLIFCRTMFIIGLWLCVSEKILPEIPLWGRNTFYIYAIHFIIVRMMNKTCIYYISRKPEFLGIIYLFMPVFVILIAAVSKKWIKKISPVAWKLLTGDR